jgi:UDP-N-acetylglucosamine 2-epimerase (non-hydrolysing)
MRVTTFLGTRPEVIRLSRVIPLLDGLVEHRLVHTGQNYDPRLSDIFFDQLAVRAPDHHLGVRGDGIGEQIGQILARGEALLRDERPDAVLILGDTNSGLISIIANRMNIPVFHMEAGNRCYDDRVPEEVNRRIIDQCSTVLLPYTHRSKENLLREGFASNRVYVTGNPIGEVLAHYAPQIAASQALSQLGVSAKHYFLVTLHRAENVDVESRLRSVLSALDALALRFAMPVVCSVHPRMAEKLKRFGLEDDSKRLQLVPPLGFFDFVRLEQEAFCVLSDSGTVQEEACLFGVPNVTLRDVTERPETLDVGSNILSGVGEADILRCVELVTRQAARWEPPAEYLAKNVASTVARIVTGHRHTGPRF